MRQEKPTMADLPFEILKQIFTHVRNSYHQGWGNSDLSHCEQTCRSWRQAAKEILYGSINIFDKEEANLLVETFISNPKLGHLVKAVDLNLLLYPETGPDATLWDRQDLFTAFAKFCPNVVTFQAFNPIATFYVRLMHAFYNNQFTKLEQIPEPNEPIDIEAYNYAALAFRGSLTDLSIFDLTYQADDIDEINYKAYNAIASQLKEFKQLTILNIMHHTSQCIMEIDSVIQDCPSLTSLRVSLFPLPQQVSHRNKHINCVIKPSLNIKSFKGCWAIMYTDDSLNYFMRKFPNLNNLHFYYRHEDDISRLFMPSVLLDFFYYVSKISHVLWDCNFQMDITNTWIRFMEMTNYQGFVGIEYDKHRQITNNQNIRVSRQGFTELLTTTLTYTVDETSEDIMPHTNLIEKIGDKVKHLSVIRMNPLQGYYIADRTRSNMVYGYWLDHIFKNCPSLKWLKISHPGSIILHVGAHQEEKYESLERLEISNMNVVVGIDPIFQALSARLPSLKYFSLYVDMEETRSIRYQPIVVTMPFTSFDTLTWSRKKTEGKVLRPYWKFHLKITTADGKVTYLVGNKSQISESNAETYKDSFEEPEDLSFDITCKKLKHFWLKYENVNRIYTLNVE